MGCGSSKPVDAAGKARSDEIEDQLRKDRMAMRWVHLLLSHGRRVLICFLLPLFRSSLLFRVLSLPCRHAATKCEPTENPEAIRAARH